MGGFKTMDGGEGMGRFKEQALSNQDSIARIFEVVDVGEREHIRQLAIQAMHAIDAPESEQIRDAWIESVLIVLLNKGLINMEGV